MGFSSKMIIFLTHLLNPVSSLSTHTPLATEFGEGEGLRMLPVILKICHLLIRECKTNFQISLVLLSKLTIEFTAVKDFLAAVNHKTIASIAARAHELRYHCMKLDQHVGNTLCKRGIFRSKDKC